MSVMDVMQLWRIGAVLRLSMDIPVPAMLAGRGLRGVAAAEPVDRRYSTPDTDVDVERALPGREVPGVTSPEREPAQHSSRSGDEKHELPVSIGTGKFALSW